MEIFKLFGSIFVNTDEADKSMQKTEKGAESIASKLGNGIKTAAKWGAGFVTAASVVSTAIFGLATNAAGTADEIDKMSQKIGISAEAYQEWSYVMGQNGMDVEKLSAGMKTLVSQMDSAASGTASAQENFDKLGISIYDASGKMKDQETILNEAMHALADMENGTEKARLATELFGKAGIDMMPMLNQGSEAMDELTNRAHDLGLIMSDDAVSAGVKLGDTIDDIKKSFSMIVTNLGAAVIPIFQQFADIIVENMPMIQETIGALAPIFAEAVSTFLPVISELAQSLLPIFVDLFNQLLPVIMQMAATVLPVIVELIQMLLPPIMQLVQTILPILMDIISAILPVIQPLIALLQPIIDLLMALIQPLIELIGAILTPLIALIAEVVAWLAEKLQPVFEIISSVISNVLNKAFESIMPVVEQVKEFLAGAWEAISNNIGTVFETIKKVFSTVWNAIKTVVVNVVDGIKDRISTVFNTIKTVISNVMNTVKNTMDTVWNGIWGTIKGVINWILGGIEGMANGVISGINSIIEGINKVVSSAGKLIGLNVAIPTMPELSLPRLEKGGVLEKGQVGVLEGNGAEAVVPLDQNDKWITRVARDMDAAVGNTDIMQKILDVLMELRDILPDEIADAVAKLKFEISNREFGRLVREV